MPATGSDWLVAPMGGGGEPVSKTDALDVAGDDEVFGGWPDSWPEEVDRRPPKSQIVIETISPTPIGWVGGGAFAKASSRDVWGWSAIARSTSGVTRTKE